MMRTADHIEKLRKLLTGSEPFSPALMTASDYVARMRAYWEVGQYDNSQGNLSQARSNYEKALTAANSAINLRLEDAGLRRERSHVLSALGYYVEAASDLREYERLH